MRRIVTTSSGLISVDLKPELSLGPMHFGFSATIDVFGSDGCETKGRTWMPDHPGSSLGEFLASYVGLPREEAETLATEIQGSWVEEWRARGGEEGERDLRRVTNRFLVAVALVVALAMTGIVLGIWFIST